MGGRATPRRRHPIGAGDRDAPLRRDQGVPLARGVAGRALPPAAGVIGGGLPVALNGWGTRKSVSPAANISIQRRPRAGSGARVMSAISTPLLPTVAVRLVTAVAKVGRSVC